MGIDKAYEKRRAEFQGTFIHVAQCSICKQVHLCRFDDIFGVFKCMSHAGDVV